MRLKVTCFVDVPDNCDSVNDAILEELHTICEDYFYYCLDDNEVWNALSLTWEETQVTKEQANG